MVELPTLKFSSCTIHMAEEGDFKLKEEIMSAAPNNYDFNPYFISLISNFIFIMYFFLDLRYQNCRRDSKESSE